MQNPDRRRPTLKELFKAQRCEWMLLGENSKVLGPVPEIKLLKALLRGGIDDGMLVHPVGQPQWRTIRSYSRLMVGLERMRERNSSVRQARQSGVAPKPAVSESRQLTPPLLPRKRASGE